MVSDNRLRKNEFDNFNPKDVKYTSLDEIKKRIRETLDKSLDHGLFFFEIDLLTFVGASKVISGTGEESKRRFDEVERFVLNSLNFEAQEFLRKNICDYINVKNFGLKLIVNEGVENVKNDNLLLKAFVSAHIFRFFLNENNVENNNIRFELENSIKSLLPEQSKARIYIKDEIFTYALVSYKRQSYAKLVKKFPFEVEQIYDLILIELKKRDIIKDKKDYIVSDTPFDDRKGRDLIFQGSPKTEDDQIKLLKEKIDSFELMILNLQSEIEYLKEQNMQLQNDNQDLMRERAQMRENILLSFFNSLNSPEFGNILDKVFLYANDFESIDPDTAKSLFINIMAVLNQNGFQAHLDKGEYKKEVMVKKEEIGTMYRTDKKAMTLSIYRGSILYPQWTLNNKVIAQKFIKLK